MADLCTVVHINVYDRDGSTLRASFTRDSQSFPMYGTQWSDLLGEIGSASMSVPLLLSVMAADPTLLDDSIIVLSTNQTTDPDTDGLTPIFGWLGEGGTFRLIGPGEEADRQRSLQCRGLLGLFDDWVVFPEGGYRDIAGDSRHFGWMSAESSNWFDADLFDGTISKTKWSDVSSTADRYRKPKDWPDPNAYWVGCGAKSKQYFRRTVTVAEDSAIRIFASADEDLRVYWDSDLVIKNNSHEVGYTELNHWRSRVAAGDHTLAVEYRKNAYRINDWGLESGWDFGDVDRMICTVVTCHPDGSTKDVLARSNDGSKWHACQRGSADRPPTWNAAGIVTQLVSEAVDRGVSSAGRVTLDFNTGEDSEGHAWEDLHEKAWPIGTRGGQVLADLGEHDVDWDMLPDLTLRGYVSQGSDVSDSVALVKGGNILSLTADIRPVVATTLLTRAAHRWVLVKDKFAEADGERVEGFLSAGNKAVSRVQAKHHARRALDHMSTARYTYTCEFLATAGCVPYLDFGKGDIVTCPDYAGTPIRMRVLSISGSCPDDGPIRWTAELRPRSTLPLSMSITGPGNYEPAQFPFSAGDVIVAVGSADADLQLQSKVAGSWGSSDVDRSEFSGHGVYGIVGTCLVGATTTSVRAVADSGATAGGVDFYRIPASVGADETHMSGAGAWLFELGDGSTDMYREWHGSLTPACYIGATFNCGSDLSAISLPLPYEIQIGSVNGMTPSAGDDEYVSGWVIGLSPA